MRYNIKGKNIEISELTREKVSHKLNRIKRLFPEDTVMDVTIKQEKITLTVEVTASVNHRIIRAEVAASELIEALDKAVDILEKQVVRYKKRLQTKSRQNTAFLSEYNAIPNFEDLDEKNDEPSIKIVRNKHFELRPMDAWEAILQMELLGHSFFVFRNGETDEINVVYKRKDGAFGLIEPEYR
ncbi:MAG: ribosome-associated translation inhibitor RaiA [Lachnospiraceae bacterium]|nr:ribosome-associated translation inhibitor RaiA [Lachnospiraceae bacterium]